MKKFAALLLALGTVAGTAVAASAQGYYFNSQVSNPYYSSAQSDWRLRHRIMMHRMYHRAYVRDRMLDNTEGDRVIVPDENRWERRAIVPDENRWEQRRVYHRDYGWHRGW